MVAVVGLAEAVEEAFPVGEEVLVEEVAADHGNTIAIKRFISPIEIRLSNYLFRNVGLSTIIGDCLLFLPLLLTPRQ